MSTHEQPSVDLARLVRAADLLRWLTGPTVSCLDGRVRATATDRTCPGARYPSRTEVASADGQNRHPTEAPRSRRRLPAEARRRSGPRRERLVTASPPALPLREHLRSQAVPVHEPIVRSDPSGTDKTATACPPGTDPVPTDHILAIVRRRLSLDWAERYNTTPVLIETFVETPRYTGAVYRASGWLHVGTTKGRGRYDRDKLYDKPKKGRLAPASAKRLETHAQSLEPAGSDKPVTG